MWLAIIQTEESRRERLRYRRKRAYFLLNFTSNKHLDKCSWLLCLTKKTWIGRPGPHNVQLTVVYNNCYESRVCVCAREWQCVRVSEWVDERGERAVACVSSVKWTNLVVSVQTCTVKLVKLRIKYPASQESVAASFQPIIRPTAGQSEGCYPRENIVPARNVSPVLLDYGLGADSR